MIKLTPNGTENIYLSSTRYLDDASYIFVASATTGTRTVQKTITRNAITLRYNKYSLSMAGENLPRGYYDYVILPATFAHTITTVTHLLLNYRQDIIEIGKLFVEAEEVTAPSTYEREHTSRKQYISN